MPRPAGSTYRLPPPLIRSHIPMPGAASDAIADQEELEQALAFPWEKVGCLPSPVAARRGGAHLLGPGASRRIRRHRQDHRGDPSRSPSGPRGPRRPRPARRASQQPLADALEKKVRVLAPETGGVVARITTASFRGIAEQMYQLQHGVRPRIASDVTRCGSGSAPLRPRRASRDFSERFLLSEWTNVIDAWGLALARGLCGRAAHGPQEPARSQPARTPLAGLRSRQGCADGGTLDDLGGRFHRPWRSRSRLAPPRPFDHVVIDEAQDLAPAELRFFAALAPRGADGLFLVGRHRPTHLPASLFLGEPRRRRPGSLADPQGLLSHLAADPPCRGSAPADSSCVITMDRRMSDAVSSRCSMGRRLTIQAFATPGGRGRKRQGHSRGLACRGARGSRDRCLRPNAASRPTCAGGHRRAGRLRRDRDGSHEPRQGPRVPRRRGHGL